MGAVAHLATLGVKTRWSRHFRVSYSVRYGDVPRLFLPKSETRGRGHSLIFIQLRPGVYYSPKEQGMGYAPWEYNIHRAFIFDKNEILQKTCP